MRLDRQPQPRHAPAGPARRRRRGGRRIPERDDRAGSHGLGRGRGRRTRAHGDEQSTARRADASERRPVERHLGEDRSARRVARVQRPARVGRVQDPVRDRRRAEVRGRVGRLPAGRPVEPEGERPDRRACRCRRPACRRRRSSRGSRRGCRAARPSSARRAAWSSGPAPSRSLTSDPRRRGACRPARRTGWAKRRSRHPARSGCPRRTRRPASPGTCRRSFRSSCRGRRSRSPCRSSAGGSCCPCRHTDVPRTRRSRACSRPRRRHVPRAP